MEELFIINNKQIEISKKQKKNKEKTSLPVPVGRKYETR